MKNKKVLANILLLITAIIWGSAFVAQRVGMKYIGPFTFNASRFIISTIVLIPVVLILGKNKETDQKKYDPATTLKASLLCGFFLFCGSTLQQFGLVFTSAGKAAFITTLYIVLVPIFGIFLGHKIGFKSWVAVFIGTVGLYFLCISESFTISKGDFIVLIGAFFWTTHVLLIDYFIPKVNPIKLALSQFAVCGILSLICALIFETIDLSNVAIALIPILYAGVLSGGIGYTFQILGQKYTSPTIASLLMSMESVFAVIAGFFLLGEIMSGREFWGCILMFGAIIISQLPDNKQIEPTLVTKN